MRIDVLGDVNKERHVLIRGGDILVQLLVLDGQYCNAPLVLRGELTARFKDFEPLEEMTLRSMKDEGQIGVVVLHRLFVDLGFPFCTWSIIII